mgnify:CR=1 FL=1
MKLIRHLMLLIILLNQSLISFSQTDIDTSSVILQEIVAREIIKDLIKRDAAIEQLEVFEKQVETLELKVTLKDSVIFNLQQQVNNLNQIEQDKSKQLGLSQELSEQLNKDLKKQKAKNFLLKLTNTGVIVIAAIVVLLGNG